MKDDKVLSLMDLLRWRAEGQGDTPGYAFLGNGETESDTLTYGQLDQRSREIAVMLQRTLNRGDRALLMYPPGLDFVSAFFGCLYAGVIAVPAFPPQLARPARSLPRLRSIASEAGISAVLCTEAIAVKLSALFNGAPELAHRPLLATDHYGLEPTNRWRRPSLEPDDIAFLQYTSGSTAAPKGVMVSHGNVLHNLAYIHDGSKHDASTVLISWLPTYHDMGLFAGVLFPLFKACPSYLMAPVSFLQKPVRWLQAISRYRGTNSGGPDFAYDLCVERTTPEQRQALDLRSWRIAFNGAEPIRKNTLEGFCRAFRDCGFRRDALYSVYGLAEATVFVCARQWSDQPTSREAAPSSPDTSRQSKKTESNGATSELVSCGSPDFGTQVIIVDPQRRTQVPPGQIGEIWVRSPSVAQGYWNRPEDTEQAFRAYLADTKHGPFLRTGDLGFVLEGELFVTGRIKDLIIIRGLKHYPQDIEQTVTSSHEGIRSNCCAAIAVPTGEGERLAIVAEVNRRRRASSRSAENGDCPWRGELDEIIGTIRQAVAEHHELQTYAVSIVPRGSIPKTSSGKIQRHACRNAVLAGTLDSLAQWTLSPDPSTAFMRKKVATGCS